MKTPLLLRRLLCACCVIVCLVFGVAFSSSLRLITTAASPQSSLRKATTITKDSVSKDVVTQSRLWTELAKSESLTNQQQPLSPRPELKNGRRFRVTRQQLVALLDKAPHENRAINEKAQANSAQSNDESERARVELELPLPNGTFKRFRVYDSPILAPELAAKFPELRTFSGQGIDDLTATTRFDLTPQGLHALILSAAETVYIEPESKTANDTYIVYYHNDLGDDFTTQCAADERQDNSYLLQPDAHSTGNLLSSVARSKSDAAANVAYAGTLRKYRSAVAATAEYTQAYGGRTVGGALAAITTTVNLVNAVYERDVAVRLILVANEDQLIFTDSATDGYTSDNVDQLYAQNQSVIDARIGAGSYDIGHVFDGKLLQGGAFSFRGRAYIGAVCQDAVKSRGATILRSVNPSTTIAYYIVAHEMGHQFGATHTMNGTTTDCGAARTPSTAYEPGSGTTIMGYRYNCGAEDFRSNETYFHNANLNQITNFIANFATCAQPEANGNNAPTVSAGNDYTIPRNTPFALTATGSDPDGDALTYTWEEYDLGAPSPPITDEDGQPRPIFFSLPPRTNPMRSFPTFYNGYAAVQGLSLPKIDRVMRFRVTARDNRANGGGIADDETTITVNGEHFAITSLGSSEQTWQAGTSRLVTWNVGGGSIAANVRISVSDVYSNMNTMVLESTPNDGAENILLPRTIRPSRYRLRIEAVDNVFYSDSTDFDVSRLSQVIVSGRVATNINQGIGGVTVTLGNSFNSSVPPITTVTDSQGYYSFTNVPANIYSAITLSPHKGFSFPAPGLYINPQTDSLNINFMAVRSARHTLYRSVKGLR